MPDNDLARVLAAVGPRLRALRRQRGTTLAALSERTGISPSTLSRLESGQRKPTLELLLPLAREYGVRLDELVGAEPTGVPRPVTRHGHVFVPLTGRLGGLRAYKRILPAGRPDAGRPAQRAHEGYGWLYVLSGMLRLALAEHDLFLGAGEAAEFDTRTPHGFENAGPEPVELLHLYGPQGERIRTRTRPADGR
ncbi:helix-turn-helix transcriptional regulator [Streptomyces olivaceiscleroticus]|uniref:XRE family transcriptional regulator n=1 Tax=Streptomyces olivaceiscleroticus TaxID=68245 RepID=A0ABP3L5I9_9ACTN